MKRWTELRLETAAAATELLVARLGEIGFTGFQQEDAVTRATESPDGRLEPIIPTEPGIEALLAYLPSDHLTDEVRAELMIALNDAVAAELTPGYTVAERTFEEEDWNAVWEATVEPVEVGQRFVVKPSWQPYEGDRLVLQIDPKMAFGTGYHETTRLVLRALEPLVQGGERVLDVGTGTGVLAIAALLLGAASALGTDLDPWSIANATENAERNGVADRFEIVETAELTAVPSAAFGIGLANIHRDVLLTLLPELIRTLAPGGTLILSGLLHTQGAELTTLLWDAGFTVQETQEGDWIALTAAR